MDAGIGVPSLGPKNGNLPLPLALGFSLAALVPGAWKFNLHSLGQGHRQRWRWGLFYSTNKVEIRPTCAGLPPPMNIVLKWGLPPPTLLTQPVYRRKAPAPAHPRLSLRPAAQVSVLVGISETVLSSMIPGPPEFHFFLLKTQLSPCVEVATRIGGCRGSPLGGWTFPRMLK